MSRIYTVQAARKTKSGDRPKCYTCREPIEVGQSYQYCEPSRFSPRFSWHATCTAPRPSVLEPNEKRSAAMAAFEDAWDALDALPADLEGVIADAAANDTDVKQEDIDQAMREAAAELLTALADALGEVAEMWRESAQSIEDGFQHATYQSDEMNENADTIDSAISDLESFDADDRVDEATDEDYIEAIVEQVRDAIDQAEGEMP